MSRTHYQIYKEQTFVLARTLIVKHEEIASSMNDELYYRGYEMDSNPYNWRYYLNLNGEYHQADKDELYSRYGTSRIMVKVPSVFGYREIPFTKEVLHGATSDQTLVNEYYIGSKLFKELVSQYPDFETLIIGILNPIDIDVAINATNGEILYLAGRYKRVEDDDSWYDTSPYGGNTTLIEEQEDNIIFELQKYINIFLRQWNNTEYAIGNDLYVVTMLGILYSNIPNVILNIRLGNCKTPRAHTFHIKQYLESFGQIGRYVDFIPIATSLWLYRNVHYLEANTGKMRTFDMLMDNTLTPNSVPIAAYTARHELSNMSDKQPLPTGMFYKEKLNNVQVLGISDDDRTVLDILKDQRKLARDNDKDLLIKESNIQTAVNWMGDDRINTKVLESEMAEIGDPYPFTFEQILFNMWGYTAIKGYYTGSVFANNPISGDRLSFTALDAYILVQYCLNKAVADVTLVNIPEVKLYNIPRTTNPGDKPSDPEYLLKPSIDTMMDWCVKDVTRRRKVVELSGSMVPNFQSKDSLEFFDNAENIYHERIRQYNLYCDIENLEERGDLELLAKRLQWVGFKETLSTLTYKDWFKTVGFDPDDYTTDDLLSLGLEIVSSATGISAQPSTSSTKWLQKSLMAILKHFLSYTVHIIEKHSDSVMAHLEGQTLRFTNLKWSYLGELEVPYRLNLSYRIKNTVKIKNRFDISNIFENSKVSINTKSEVGYDLSNLAYGQTTHKLDVGTYQLGVGLFDISIKETAPNFIQITVSEDDRISLLPVGMSASIVDDTVDLGTTVDVNSTVIDNIDMTLEDMVDNTLTVSDTNSLTPMYIELTFDSIITEHTGDSSNELQIGSISASLVDSILDLPAVSDNSYIDQTILNLGLNDDVVIIKSIETTKSSLIMGDVTGSVINPVILFQVTDTSGLSIDTMSIRLGDPQIPSVFVSDMSGSLSVVNMTGSSSHVAFEMFAKDTMSVLAMNMQANVVDSYVATIETESNDTADAVNISANILDVGEVTTPSDINVLQESKIQLLATDDIIDNSTQSDTMSVKITKMVIDSRVQVIVRDLGTISVTSMLANVIDEGSTYRYVDENAIQVNSSDVSGTVTEMPDALELIDDKAYSLGIVNVGVSKFEYSIDYQIVDNGGIVPSNISLKVDAPEVILPLVKDVVHVQADIRYLSGQSVDVNPDMVSYDNTAFILSTLRGGIIDESIIARNLPIADVQLVINMEGGLVDDSSAYKSIDGMNVQPTSITIQSIDAVPVPPFSDGNGVVNYRMYTSVVDSTIDVSIQSGVHSVDLHPNTVTLKISDSDIMRSATDLHGLTINSAAISITVVDDNTTQNP